MDMSHLIDDTVAQLHFSLNLKKKLEIKEFSY